MPSQVLDRVQRFRIFLCQRQPLLVTGQFIRIPYITGKETRTPVINGNIMNISLLINSTRVEDFTGFLNNIGLKRFLRHRIINILLYKVVCRLLLSCTTCQNKKGNAQCSKSCFHK